MRPGIPFAAIALVTCPAPALQAQSKSDAEAMVKKAIAFAKAQGMEKALAEISKPGGSFTKGELYVFVYDLNGTVKAHGQNAKLVGKEMLQAKDPDGTFYVKEHIALVKGKGHGWQDYKFSNPVSKKIEAKMAYVELFEGMIFGCGIYK